jgi:penicillin-binding protein 1A
MKWALRNVRGKRESELLSRGDVIWVRPAENTTADGERELRLEQTPEAQAALICLEAGTGYVKAIVGGRDFKESQFNRAIQSKRQPGSAFKPIIYSAALDKGYTPASMISDNVFIYKDENMTWKPKNYDKKIYGSNLLRTALAHSRNLSTINLLDRIGVGYVINYSKKLGITSDLSRNLSIALGSSGVSLLELVTAYSVFANEGYRIAPVFITGIKDRHGGELEGLNIDAEQVIDKETAYLMTNLMESVVKEGTGKNVLALNRPVAGKTGTTNNLNDAWFMGYTTEYIAGAWVGYDQERSLGPKETGGRAASPIWLDFMQTIHVGIPVKDFEVPEGIVFSKIDSDTGLLPSPGTRNVRFECFREGTAPTRYSKKAEAVTENEQFFKMDM